MFARYPVFLAFSLLCQNKVFVSKCSSFGLIAYICDTNIHYLPMIHTGLLIRNTLREQGHTVTWFAAQLCCTRSNAYKIFRKNNIDIELLWRISLVLGHNFFGELSGIYEDNPQLLDEE